MVGSGRTTKHPKKQHINACDSQYSLEFNLHYILSLAHPLLSCGIPILLHHGWGLPHTLSYWVRELFVEAIGPRPGWFLQSGGTAKGQGKNHYRKDIANQEHGIAILLSWLCCSWNHPKFNTHIRRPPLASDFDAHRWPCYSVRAVASHIFLNQNFMTGVNHDAIGQYHLNNASLAIKLRF